MKLSDIFVVVVVSAMIAGSVALLISSQNWKLIAALKNDLNDRAAAEETLKQQIADLQKQLAEMKRAPDTTQTAAMVSAPATPRP